MVIVGHLAELADRIEASLEVADEDGEFRARELGWKATAAFVFAVIGLVIFPLSIGGVVYGFKAHDEIDTERVYGRSTPRNSWMALAAIVIGIVGTIGWVVTWWVLFLTD